MRGRVELHPRDSNDFQRRQLEKTRRSARASRRHLQRRTLAGGNGTDTIVHRRVVNALLGVQKKRRVFVSYYHGGDRSYYDLFYKTFCGQFDVVQDNSPERRIDSDDAEYVLRRLRENHISGSSCTIVLVGQETFGRRYVDWEIEATLESSTV